MNDSIYIFWKHSLKLFTAKNIRQDLLQRKTVLKGHNAHSLHLKSHLLRQLVWKQDAPVHLVVVLPAPSCVLVHHEPSNIFEDVRLLLLSEALIQFAQLRLF